MTLLDDAKSDHLREIRRLETDLRLSKASYLEEKRKRELAEEDLDEALKRESLLLATKEQIKEHVIRPPKKTGNRTPVTPIICCNDWHAEAKIDPVLVNELNEFNLKIFEKRVQRLWEKSIYLIDFWRGVSDVKDAVLWIGGDMISGSIHEDLEESNFLGPTEAIQYVVDKIDYGINYILTNAKIDKLHVICNFGNHGRTTKKKRVQTAHLHSYEWLAYNQLAKYWRADSRVTFQISNGYHAYCEIQGWVVRFHHGDGVRYQGGVGGLTIPLNKSIAQWNKSKRADYDICGHFHSFQDNYNWVACGSLIGYDSYALSIKADFQRPTQTLIILDREYGKVASLPIFV